MAKLKNIKLVSLGKYLSKYELSYETRDGGEKQYEMVSNNRELTVGAIGQGRQALSCWSSMRPRAHAPGYRVPDGRKLPCGQ